MRKIIAIAWKDIRLRFTGWMEWLFFIILPVMFTLIIGGGTGAPADNRIRLGIVDQAKSPLSKEFIQSLEKSTAVRPEEMTLVEAESQFSQRRMSAMLVIPSGFDIEHLQQEDRNLDFRQQPNSMNGLIAYRAVQAVVSRVSSTVDIAKSSVSLSEGIKPFTSDSDRQAYFALALENAQVTMNAAPNRILDARGNTKDIIEYDPQANSSAGQIVTWVFIPLIGMSAMFAYERQKGTLRRLLTTPTSRATYLLGTISGQVVVALFQMLLLVGFGILVLHLKWGQNIPALILVLVSSALAAASLGTMLGTLVKTEGQANGLSVMLGMSMAMLGGCWYPIELFPRFVQAAVKILPTTWAMQGMLGVVLRGQGVVEILPAVGVLLGFAVLFFTVGVLRFKYE